MERNKMAKKEQAKERKEEGSSDWEYYQIRPYTPFKSVTHQILSITYYKPAYYKPEYYNKKGSLKVNIGGLLSYYRPGTRGELLKVIGNGEAAHIRKQLRASRAKELWDSLRDVRDNFLGEERKKRDDLLGEERK